MADDGAPAPGPGRVLGRRRRGNVAGGRAGSHRVRVTPEEQEALVERAQAQGISVPRLLVESALSEGGETPSQRREAMVELFALRRLLAAVSSNVNQVARHANATEGFPEDAAAVLVGVRRVVERIDVAIDDLSDASRPWGRR